MIMAPWSDLDVGEKLCEEGLLGVIGGDALNLPSQGEGWLERG